MEPEFKKNLIEIDRLSHKLGSPIYLVGGTLRDILATRPCTDFDFTSHQAPGIASAFAEQAGRKYIPLDETPGHETFRVVIHRDLYFDFTTLQGESIESDLTQRDFTINAMGLALPDYIEGKLNLIDPFRGQDDLKSHLVRVLPGPTFEDDPLRLLRAFRFAATLGFDIDPETLQQITRHRSLIDRVAKERVTHELLILFSADHSGFDLLDRTGLAQILFPEIARLKTATGHREGTSAWDDVLKRFRELESLIIEPGRFLDKHAALIKTFLSENRHRPMLKWSFLAGALYPGKEPSSSVTNGLKKFRLSNEDIHFAERTLRAAAPLISYPSSIEFGEDAAVYRWIKTGGQESISALLLGLAYRLGNQEDIKLFTERVNRILDFFIDRFQPMQDQPALLNGEVLKNKFKLSPSPLFRTILEQVEEARVLGSIRTPEDAERLARNIINSQT